MKALVKIQLLYDHYLFFKISKTEYIIKLIYFQIQGIEDNALKDINREDVKITVKVFISSPDVNLLKEAIDQGIYYTIYYYLYISI